MRQISSSTSAAGFQSGGYIWDTRFKAALYLRDYDAVNRVIAATPAKFVGDVFDGQPLQSWADRQIASARGDKHKAQAAFAAAREKREATSDDKSKDPPYFADIAKLDAWLGRKEEAIREALRAVELDPIAKDSLNGPTWVADLALVYAWTGERNRALDQLEIVATIPAMARHMAIFSSIPAGMICAVISASTKSLLRPRLPANSRHEFETRSLPCSLAAPARLCLLSR